MMPSGERAPRETRADYRHFSAITTRWSDNDMYGHVNNVAYYSFFDTAVNAWLIAEGLVDPMSSDVIGLVVETGCRYFAPLSYPEPVEAGIAVERIGNSSVTYLVGIFAKGADEAAAAGRFTHVYVGAQDRRPKALSEAWREKLGRLVV